MGILAFFGIGKDAKEKPNGKANGKAIYLEAEPREDCPKRKKRRTTLILADRLVAEDAEVAQVEEEDEVQKALDEMRAERQATVTMPFMESISGLDDVAQAYLNDQLAEESVEEEEHHDGR